MESFVRGMALASAILVAGSSLRKCDVTGCEALMTDGIRSPRLPADSDLKKFLLYIKTLCLIRFGNIFDKKKDKGSIYL